MKKLFILTIICTSLLVNPLSIYAGDTTDVSASVITDLIEKAINSSDDKEDTIEKVKDVYFKDDRGIRDLKTSVSIELTEDRVEKLNDMGVEVKDVMDGIDSLKDWSYEERIKLVDYVADGKLDDAADLIVNGGENETTIETGPSGGGVTPEEKVAQESVEEAQKEELKHKFNDIEGHWAEESIAFMTNMGIVSGLDEETFNPNGQVTRAEMATLMVKILDIDINTLAYIPFEDVQTNDWYYKYVRSAYNNKIISGMNEKSFNPEGNITREQMITMAINTLKDNDIDISEVVLDEYKDSSNISSWAVEFIKKGKKLGIIRENENLNPQEIISRAEAVWILDKVYKIKNQNKGE
ncbi:S-layer homology domain-containing protein [Anaeromicrobium sediminis]|uniref:SLH domain-containing protein n=1 Tax=Anaeromicrobium sediminis TaxID=1478221 RepID=A0A267MIX2_9FIRM|nr:S-layer homology domain-containing protein [Anaeromicrobium sediminis]PAB59397.1 hypothetical protein CCE28_11110 [Anaeromicrobium sediminis]